MPVRVDVMLTKLRFSIAHCSSEEDKFPATELTRSFTASRGWQCRKDARFPVVVILDLGSKCDVSQIQILAHECKVARRIGISTSDDDGAHYETAAFVSRGYVPFQHNRENTFKSGELRSCRVSLATRYVKFLFDDAHEHPLNFNRQIGLHSIVVAGPKANFAEHAEGHDLSRRSVVDRLAADLRYDAAVLGRVRELEFAKSRAAEMEDFETARRLKEQIDSLLPIAQQINECETRKRQATLEEDFQLAQLLKAEIDDLRAQAMSMSGGAAALVPPALSMRYGVGVAGLLSSSSASPLAASRNAGAESPQKAGGVVFNGNASSGGNGGFHGSVTPASPIIREDHPTPMHQPTPARSPPKNPNSFDEQPAFNPNYNGRNRQPAMTEYPEDAHTLGGGSGPQVKPGETLDRSALSHSDTLMAEKIAQFAGIADAPEDVRKTLKDVPTVGEMLAAFGLYTVCCLFSRRHQLREGACVAIGRCGDAILHSVDATDLVNAVVMFAAAKNAGISDKVHSVALATNELIAQVLGDGFQGDCSAALKSFAPPLLPPLVSRIGDSNEKVRDAAVATLQTMMSHPQVGLDPVAKHIMTGKHGTAPRTWLSRMDLVQYAVEHVVGPRSALDDQPVLSFDKITKNIVTPAISHANAGVRERAVTLLCAMRPRVGDAAVAEFAKKQKPTMRNVIEKRLEEPPLPPVALSPPKRAGGASSPAATVPGNKRVATNRPGVPDDEADGDEEGAGAASASPQVHRGRIRPKRSGSGGGKGGGGPAMNGGALGAGHGSQSSNTPPPSGTASAVEAADHSGGEEEGDDADVPRRAQPQPVPGQCQFCGTADAAFRDHAELVQHFKTECPMLVGCPLCRYPVEIREVNTHMTDDCERRSRVKKCPRCRRAVRLDQFDQHVAAATCPPYSADTIVCALCDTRLPNIDAFWAAHILEPPYCSGNTRSVVE